jgi:hypothetical protein
MHTFLTGLLLLVPVFQAQVHVVDPAGGGEFLGVGQAIAAASTGDVVLLRPGAYAGEPVLLPAGKAVAVVADSAAQIALGPLTVEGVNAADAALMQGLLLVTSMGPPDRIESSAGAVWIERCSFEHEVQGVTGIGGVLVTDSASVVLTHADLGAPYHLLATPPSLEARASRVHVHATAILGRGDDAELGATAVLLQSGSSAELLGASVQGGAGRNGNFFHCDGYDGGIGLTLDSSASASALGSTFEGGAGGQPLSGCSPGLAGADVVAFPGSTLTTLAGVARSFEVSSPVREGELVQASFTGRPGDLAWLAFSSRPAPGRAFRALDGELLLESPQLVFLGIVPASGTLVVTTPPPSLAPGAEAQVFYGQPIFRDAQTGRFVAGAPSALVALDGSL